MSDNCECDICHKLSERRQNLLDEEICRWESQLKISQQTQNQKAVIINNVINNEVLKDEKLHS